MPISMKLLTIECDKDPHYQPLTTFFGQNWPARDSKFMPDFLAFDPDRHSYLVPPHNMLCDRTSRTTITPRDLIPHDAFDDQFPIFMDGTNPWEDQMPADFEDVLFGTEFDHSCLHPLDKQLLLRPTDSFMDLCWAEAVEDRTSPRRQSVRLEALYNDSIDYQSYPDEDDLTPNAGRSEASRSEASTPVGYTYTKNLVDFAQDSFSHTPPSSPLSVAENRGHKPLVFLDAHFPVCNPNDSIHAFPISPLASRRQRGAHRKPPHIRIAAFCSNLPGRLVKSASAA